MASSSPIVPETKMNGVCGDFAPEPARMVSISLVIFRAEKPSKAGSEQSERIRSKLLLSRAPRKSAWVSTRKTSQRMPSFSKVAKISSASAGLSSNRRIRSGEFMTISSLACGSLIRACHLDITRTLVLRTLG